MENATRFYLFTAILIGIGIIFFWQFEKARRKKMNEAKEIYIQYQNALKRKDKVQALELGRKYYVMLRRRNRLTIYDEQAITNDLNSIS